MIEHNANSLRDPINEVAVDAIARGNLDLIRFLAGQPEELPYLLEILDRTELWPVRVAMSELLLAIGHNAELSRRDRRRVFDTCCALAEASRMRRLSKVDLVALRTVDPERSRDISGKLDAWFFAVAAEIESAQRRWFGKK